MALRFNFSLLWLSIIFIALFTQTLGQKTYSRACQCEKTVNGQCAYTLLMPVSSPENGECLPSSSGGGSTAELEEAVQQLSQNVTDLQLWSGELAKTLITLQNSVSDQGALVNSVSKTAQESLDSVLTSQEQLRDANTRIAELVRSTTHLEEELISIKANNYLCMRKGLLVSGEESFIPDASITSSSMYDTTHTPERARINTNPDDQASGAWCPKEPNTDEWIQFDLGSPQMVYGVVTRGRADYTQWVTSYNLQYGDAPPPGMDMEWTTYTDILGQELVFKGNSDQNSLQTNMLWQPITTQMIRLIPLSAYENSNKCMRADLIGCVDTS